jgi:hypothetical protein
MVPAIRGRGVSRSVDERPSSVPLRAADTIAGRWRAALGERAFRIQLIGMGAALVAALSAFARFLGVNEARAGAALADPLLAILPAHDMTWVAFALIYVSLFSAIYSLVGRPRELLVAITSYAVLAIVRMTMMYATPLEAPVGFIPLVDPVIEFFGTGTTVNKDLFFSGHTSTLFLLYLTATRPRLRALFLACTIAVAACVLIQHVHYTVDVLVAPFASYGCWRIARWSLGKGGGRRDEG